MTDLKRCSRCDSEKPLMDFHATRRSTDGRKSTCKACHRMLYATPSHARRRVREHAGQVAAQLAHPHGGRFVCHLEKPCIKCGTVKPVREFRADSRRPDGRSLICSACPDRNRYTFIDGKRKRKPEPIDKRRECNRRVDARRKLQRRARAASRAAIA